MGNNGYASFLFTCLRNVFRISLLLLFLIVPVAYHQSLASATISSKTFYFIDGLAVLVIVGVFLTALSGNRGALKISAVDLALLVFLLFLLLNRYLLQEAQGFSLRFIELPGLALLYFLLRNVTLRDLLYITLAILLAGAFLAVYGTLLLLGYLPPVYPGAKIIAGFLNAGPYAGYLVAVGSLALGMYLFKANIHKKVIDEAITGKRPILGKAVSLLFEYIPLLAVGTVLIVLPSTRSRAAWIALLLAAAILLLLRYKDNMATLLSKLRIPKGVTRIVLVVIALIAISWGSYKAYHMNNDSADGRLLVWKVTGTIIKDHFITGVGYDRFKAYYMDAQANWFSHLPAAADTQLADNTYYAFNEALQLLVENGVVGLLLVGLIILACIRTKVNKEDAFLKQIAGGTLIAIVVFGLFSYPMQILPIKMVLVLSLALLARIDIHPRILFSVTPVTIPNKWILPGKVILLLGGIALSIGMIRRTDTLQSAFRNWQSALSTYNNGLYKESIVLFENAWTPLQTEGDYLMQYGKALSMAGEHARAKQVLEQAKPYLNTSVIQTTLGDAYVALKQYKEAETAYTKAAMMIPGRFYPEYLLAKLYNNTQQKEKAWQKAKEILEKDVKIHSAAIEEMREEMKLIMNNAVISTPSTIIKTMPIE